MWYLSLKWVHIISSVLLVGTGFGSAFYLYFIHRTANQPAIAQVIRLVVRADYWFTLPTIFIQPLTGFAMIYSAQYKIEQTWIISASALYLLAGACWIPVYFLQLRMLKIADRASSENMPLPSIYWRYARYWEWLGYPAFIAMLLIFWLMVFKPY
jgi:uncharacterized membrane protein